MSNRNIIEAIILMVTIFMGALLNAENQEVIHNFVSAHQSIAAAIIGSVIASTIAVAGWICAYYFNNKVQEKRLKSDIMNTARKETVEAIREYQKWLMKVITDLDDMMDGIKNNYSKPWLQVFDEHRRQYPNSWNETLDDYQILFPETAEVGIKLQYRSIEIDKFLSDTHFDLLTPTMFEPNSANKVDMLKEYEFYRSYVMNQFGLMEDLRIYLQNRCLSEITGNKVPERDITDESLPHIFITNKGLLDIKNNSMGVRWLVQEIQKNS